MSTDFFLDKINYGKIRMMLSFTHLNPPHLIYYRTQHWRPTKRMCIFWFRIYRWYSFFLYFSCQCEYLFVWTASLVRNIFVNIAMCTHEHWTTVAHSCNSHQWVIEPNIHIFTIILLTMLFFVSLNLTFRRCIYEYVWQSIYCWLCYGP